MRLDNAARGLADESGEISGAVKKHIEYGQPLDRENLKEEVGDCLYRLSQLCDAIGYSLGEAMDANVRKLKCRFPIKFEDALAHESGRDRDKESKAMKG